MCDLEERRKKEFLENSDYFFETKGKTSASAYVCLDFCGFEHCLPRHSYGPDIRKNYVIHVVLDGKGMLDHMGKRWWIEKGQAFILYPGEENTYYADKNEPWYYCWIGFHGDGAERILEKIGFSRSRPVLTLGDVSGTERMIMEMLSSKSLSLDGKLLRSACMLKIFSEMIAEGAQGSESVETLGEVSYSEYAVRYINNHFSEKIRIRDLAERIGISRSYLVKLMKQETGMSPQEFLIETRMRRAKDLLTRTHDPIRNIASECGYDDALAFSKVFKSRFGMNPSDYRQTFGKSSREKL